MIILDRVLSCTERERFVKAFDSHDEDIHPLRDISQYKESLLQDGPKRNASLIQQGGGIGRRCMCVCVCDR